MIHVRPFTRHDRHGLARLTNIHVATVLPGASIPTSTLLAQLEQDVDEYIVDPWAIDRHTLVAIEAERVVAAAHLVRYGRGEPVSGDYDDAAEVKWLLCWPDSIEAGRAVIDAAFDHLRAWTSRVWYADGNLPCPGVYGIPASWPHIVGLVEDAGFVPGRVEALLVGDLAAVAPPGPAPVDGVVMRRRVGSLGTRFDAELDGKVIGSFEVDSALDKAGTLHALSRLADVANHWVAEGQRGRGIGTWLFDHGCVWLRLAGIERLLAYSVEEDAEATAHFYGRRGLTEIGRTRRGWHRDPA